MRADSLVDVMHMPACPDIRKYEACMRRGREPYSNIVVRSARRDQGGAGGAGTGVFVGPGVGGGDAGADGDADDADDDAWDGNGRPRQRLGDLSASIVALRQDFASQANIARIIDRIR